MKTKILSVLIATLFVAPAWAGGGSGHGSGSGTSAAPTANATSSATGGAGGSGGSAAGGSATGGSSTSSGNTATVSVSVTTPTGSGSGAGGETAALSGPVGDPGSSAYNSKSTVDYGGTYTVKTVPNVIAPSLTATLSDTCMGSASFGLSFVGFGATGGSTMVDDACVRRLDSREFRAMGLNDVALALLCQSESNKKAVESTGRACPSAPKTAAATPAVAVMSAPTVVSVSSMPVVATVTTSAVIDRTPTVRPLDEPVAERISTSASEQYTDPLIRRRLGLEPVVDAAAQ
jgi:hypothetical protein